MTGFSLGTSSDFGSTRPMSTKPGQPYLNGRDTPSQPGDDVVGGWTHEQLMRMDARFRERLERAIARGKEHPKDDPARTR